VTALVGPSGSGKSTIAALVARFRDVREGAVSIGGVDVRDMAIDQLMETVAFVFQDTFLFSDTIAANIRFGNPEASDDQVRAAAEAARAHDFIMALDHGYDTRLGEQGRTLSGGERQRIAIARAILKDAPVIVLDEATAFADPDNEAAIQDAIAALTKGRTLIIVAHRLHTIMAADQILCIDRGHVAERGRHEQLLEQHGLYARLWEDYLHARNTPLRPASHISNTPVTITQEAV
jgi:ATP-binding cassette subfamily B protein